MKEKSCGLYKNIIKRFLDIVFSALALILFWWLYLVLAILIKVNLGSPVIFTQERPGKDGKIFKLYKFRSMSSDTDENGNLLPDSKRLNNFGKVLRSTSLDELPELFNIIIGDMSIVGPRPLLVKYLQFYNEEEDRRHEMRPGLTGLAQVSGRNALTWKERFLCDIQYVDHVSFWMDFKIILLTIKKIFVREGIEFKNQETIMDYFNNRTK